MLGTLFQSRRRWIALGVVVGLVIAGTAIALILATARFNDNNVASPLIEAPPPPPATIAVAVEADFNNCSVSLNYEEVSSFTLFDLLILDYSDPYGLPVAASSDGPGYMCVKNQSPDTPFAVNFVLENVVSLDLGCDPDEADPLIGGDLECNSMDPGELGDGALLFAYVEVAGGGSFCQTGGASLANGTLGFAANLDPSGWCAFDIQLFDWNAYNLGIAPDPIYSTDNVTFDVVVEADDNVVLTTWWPDNDSDGFGDGSEPSIDLFFGLSSYVDNDTDCDDTDPAINPSVPEIPEDLIDNNCDGFIDEV